MCKERSIGFLIAAAAENQLWIWFNSCDFGGSNAVDEDLKEFAWMHASPCNHCGCARRDYDWTIFGRAYHQMCHSPLAFLNPDAKALEKIEKLFLLLRQSIFAE